MCRGLTRAVFFPDAGKLPSISCQSANAMDAPCYLPFRRYPFLLPNLFGASAALLMLPLVFFWLPETRAQIKDARNDPQPVPSRCCSGVRCFPKAGLRHCQ